LLDKIHQARDELGFTPNEPFERIVEQLSGRWIGDEDSGTDTLTESLDELERRNTEARQLKREIEKLHEELKRCEKLLADRQDVSTPEVVAPLPRPAGQVADLRTRIATLKSVLNQRHSERNQLRRELESTQSDL
jgi:chromosome segregation ATPase